ncbi:hypothetical protein AWJ20_4262 [Sugiyamaella lignohabitans]|uniref:Uncharacterized protein n=1 Tax=Sugiyamaella lignohabitans TaxID=796027 RepID=A0A161HFR8_9ASCO|nr:uncharacterized protein AWJ20_4262 [Sugiyamaella lignohabitans]ANB11451.1 hypothetical protein AWJ20_4262 [Sugiyamaella lignohabitans]
MPLNFLGSVITEGTGVIPYYDQIKRYGPPLLVTGLLKRYFAGATNTWERDLHGRVVIITGGTSGLGAAVARDLAERGAQLILLVKTTQDEWLVNFINDLRDLTGNHLIYAEEADLADFYSVRKFATKWINNSPPRRLDMVICCAGVALPPSSSRAATQDGVELHLQTNYMGHYHLLNILSPALRAQPPDRDVRVILTSCISSVMADFDIGDLEFSRRGYPSYRPWRVFGSSKLALTLFGYEFQRRLNEYERPDKAPNNVHVSIVDPGMMRSPSFKRFVSMGSLIGLLIYVLLWPIWWFFLKTSIDGSQSILFAAMSPEVKDTLEATYISECRVRQAPPRKEITSPELQKDLFEVTDKIVQETEKSSVIARKRMESKNSEKPNGDTSSFKTDNSTKKPACTTAKTTATSQTASSTAKAKKTKKTPKI